MNMYPPSKIRTEAVCTIGKFDPVHPGHCKLFKTMEEIAEKTGTILTHIGITQGAGKLQSISTRSENIEILHDFYCPPKLYVVLDMYSFFTFLKSNGYNHLNVIVGEDRFNEAVRVLKNPIFKSITYRIMSVDRDENSISSTKIRRLLDEKDHKSLYKLYHNKKFVDKLIDEYDPLEYITERSIW